MTGKHFRRTSISYIISILLSGTQSLSTTTAFTITSQSVARGIHQLGRRSNNNSINLRNINDHLLKEKLSSHNIDHDTTEHDVSTRTVRSSSKQPTSILMNSLQHFTGNHEASATNTIPMAVAALAFAVMLSSPISADAAMSGGRMGGSFSRSSGSSGMTRMAPSTRTYNYYGGGSSYYSRPSSIISAPIIVPFVNPFPPVYYGGSGVISYSRGPGLFDFLILGGIGFFILNAIRSASAFGSDTLTTWTDSSSNLFTSGGSSALGSGSSVIQLSVALNVPNRDDPSSILSVFDRLARTAKTDSRVGVQNLTSQVALELLRRKSSITAAFSRSVHFNDANKAQREYNTWSVRERSKFEKELVSKYGGVDYAVDRRTSSATVMNGATMAVVTIILSITGDSTKIPRIQSVKDVEEALRKISTDSKVDDCLTGAEILWTPEDRSETLSYRDVIADYPELRSL
jgi:uncharacterized membrane protein